MKTNNVDVVINYFNPSNHKSLIVLTYLAALKYKQNNVNIIISDGSGFENIELSSFCKEEDFSYVFSNHKLSFAEGYNQGAKFSIKNYKSKFIILSANDIFVDNNTVEKLIKRFDHYENIGCVIPYLSTSDLPEQNNIFNRGDRFPNGMTLNVNLFTKTDLQDIGFVPENLVGSFNDLVMFIKLIGNNKKILLTDAGNITHIGRSTTSMTMTAKFEKDFKYFSNHYPELKATNKNLHVRYAKFSQNKIDKFIFSILDNINSKFLTKFILRIHRTIALRFNYEK